MRSADQIHIMFLKESRDNVRSEREGDTAIILAPASDIFVWVRPQKITEQAAVRNLEQSVYAPATLGLKKTAQPRNQPTYVSWSHNTTDLLHRVQIWGETTVHSEDLLVNNGSNWKAVETVSKGLPELDVVSTLALIIETVDSVNGSALVVTTEDEEVFWIFDFVCKKEADCLERLLSSVNVITKEQVISLWWESAVFEQAQEIVVLTVDITANLFEKVTKSASNLLPQK